MSLRGGVRFSHDGVGYELRFTMNALCAYEEAAGETAFEAIGLVASGRSGLARIRRLFAAGVVGLSAPAQVGDLIDQIGLDRAIELLGRAFALAMPSAAGAAPEKPAATISAVSSL